MKKEKNILYVKEMELNPGKQGQNLEVFGMSRLLSIGENKDKPVALF